MLTSSCRRRFWISLVPAILLCTTPILVVGNAFNRTSPALLAARYLATAPSTPADEPAPSPVNGTTLTPSYEVGKCNICGDGNIVGSPKALVTFKDHAKQEQTLECADLQNLANAPNTPYPDYFCPDLQGFAKPICGCTTPSGDVLSPAPTATPTSVPTDTPPSLPPGVWVVKPSAAPYPGQPTLEPGSFCNLCGEGNSIGKPQATFKFTDKSGEQRELGCQQVQDLLDTGKAPTGWCEIVQAASVDDCQCRLPDGSLVSGGTEPPSPSERHCWVCGYTEGVKNEVGDGEAVVDYIDHEGILRKFPCKSLAQMSEDSIAVPLSYCAKFQAQARIPCRCTTPAGDLLSDLYPTFSPADGGKPATPAYIGNLDDDEPLPAPTIAKTDDITGDNGGGNGDDASGEDSSSSKKKSDGTTTNNLLLHWRKRVSYFLSSFIINMI